MNHPLRILRIAIVLEWLCIIAAMFAYAQLRHTLPGELLTYMDDEKDAGSSLAEAASMAVFVVLLVTEFVAAVFLWFRRRWARLPYVLALILLEFLILTDGATVGEPVSTLLGNLSLLAAGAVVALIYCAPIPFHVPAVRPPGPVWKRHVLATSVGIIGVGGLIFGVALLTFFLLADDSGNVPEMTLPPIWIRRICAFLFVFCSIHFSSYLLPRRHRQTSAMISGLVILCALVVGCILAVPISRVPSLIIPLLSDFLPIIGAILASALVHAIHQRFGRGVEKAPPEAAPVETP